MPWRSRGLSQGPLARVMQIKRAVEMGCGTWACATGPDDDKRISGEYQCQQDAVTGLVFSWPSSIESRSIAEELAAPAE